MAFGALAIVLNPKGKRKRAAQETHGGGRLRPRSGKQATAGKKWRDWLKTGTGGEMRLMAYAPGGAAGLSK